MHGQGTLVNHQTNTSYKGNWVNGIREGFGEQTFPTGEIYRGDWKAGAMDGEGMVLYPNQDRFQGHWENGNRVKGSFLMKNSGIIFKENWIQDTPGGYGQIEFNSGGRYVGEVKCTPFGKHQIKNFYIFRDGFVCTTK
uniref:MORN repeat-containing protein 5 n=1 Tax=Arcella intermedia TaxID=1963864 RepID=A0A6B2LN11_9EUKA